MRLNNAEILKLLPAWMREDPSIQGLAAGTDEVIHDIAARIKLLSRWDVIDQLDSDALDEMAWELNIKWYDSTASLSVKRSVIRHSDMVYSKLGTPYAVEQIVKDYFGSGEVVPWYDYEGREHHFKIRSGNAAQIMQNLDRFLILLDVVKRRSSKLDAIEMCLSGDLDTYYGMAVREHSKEYHVMGTPESIAVE